MSQWLVVGLDRRSFWPTKETKILFRGRDLLLRPATDKFEAQSEDRYHALGIPYRRGLLFAGYPGCGKTLTLKALAYNSPAKVITVLDALRLQRKCASKHIESREEQENVGFCVSNS